MTRALSGAKLTVIVLNSLGLAEDAGERRRAVMVITVRNNMAAVAEIPLTVFRLT